MSPKAPEKIETPFSPETLAQLQALEPGVVQAVAQALSGLVHSRFDEQKKTLERTGSLVGEVALSVKKLEADSSCKDGFASVIAKLSEIQDALGKQTQSSEATEWTAAQTGVQESLTSLQLQITDIKAVVATQADILLALKKTQEEMISAVSHAMSSLYDSLEELKPAKKRGLFGKK